MPAASNAPKKTKAAAVKNLLADSSVQKQCQAMIAFACYIIASEKYGNISSYKMYDVMFKTYHGEKSDSGAVITRSKILSFLNGDS